MAREFVRVVALAIVGGCAAAAAFSEEAADTCDRECLTGFADRFLKAIVEHEPSRAQLAKTVKYTENGQTLKPGDGLWATATENASYRLYAADPAAGQVALLGVLKENGAPVILSLRLRVERRQITQAELIVARNELAAFYRPELLVTPKSVFLETPPNEELLPRESLLGIVNGYFEALDEPASARRVPFDKECQRIENGVETAAASDPGADSLRHMSCGEQLNTGFSKIITAVRERRFPVVDAERGLVFAMALFDYAGVLKTIKLDDGTVMTVPPWFLRPSTFMVGGLFKIKAGKLRQIEAVVLPVPYGMRSGWSSF